MENVYLIADNHFFVIIVFLSDAVMHLLYPSPKNVTTAYRHVVVTVKRFVGNQSVRIIHQQDRCTLTLLSCHFLKHPIVIFVSRDVNAFMSRFMWPNHFSRACLSVSLSAGYSVNLTVVHAVIL